VRPNRTALAYGVSLLCSIVGHVLAYQVSHGDFTWALGASVLIFGLALGLVIGWLLGRAPVGPVATGALSGISLLLAPLVLGSPSVAAMGLFVVIAYTALVALSAKLGARKYIGSGKSSSW
jgi:hypothetical protein